MKQGYSHLTDRLEAANKENKRLSSDVKSLSEASEYVVSRTAAEHCLDIIKSSRSRTEAIAEIKRRYNL
jgi:hypothetical protein